MKRKALALFGMFVFFNTPAASWAETKVVISADEMVRIRDISSSPALVLVAANGDFVSSSAIVTWRVGETGVAGLVDIVAYSFPDGGRYAVSLDWVTGSDDTKIEGLWTIEKNGVVQLTGAPGEMKDLDTTRAKLEVPHGGDKWKFIADITDGYDGLLDPIEIRSQIMNNGSPVVGALCRLKQQGGGTIDVYSDVDGVCIFVGESLADLKRLRIVFMNYNPNMDIEGFMFADGLPVENASVEIKNTATLDATTTDSGGYFASVTISGATPPPNSNGRIKVIIKP